MSEDRCEAMTADDERCQNPTTDENDPDCCWIPSHNDPDAENPMGRDFAISDEDHEDILEAARMGLSKAGCARAAGCEKSSLLRYLDDHPEFRTDFMRARAEGEERLARGALYKDPTEPREMDGQHARFLLSTSFGYVKTEKREVEMDADVDTDVDIDFSDADT
jgi:hypothetical protein